MKTFQNLGDGARRAPVRSTGNLPGALRDRSGSALATVVLHRCKIRRLKPYGLADCGYIKRAKKTAPAL
jgi:hypothetical protein